MNKWRVTAVRCSWMVLGSYLLTMRRKEGCEKAVGSGGTLPGKIMLEPVQRSLTCVQFIVLTSPLKSFEARFNSFYRLL